MWSQPPQWLQASHYENVPHNQVDWATLAKQWISMQQQPTHPMMPPVLPPPPAYAADAGTLSPPRDNVHNQDAWSQNSQGSNSDGYFKRVGQPPPPPPPPPPLPSSTKSSSIWVSPPPEFLPSTRQVVDYSHGGSTAPSRPSSVVMDYAHGDGANATVPERRVVDYGHGFSSQSGTSMPPVIAPAASTPASSAAATDSTIAIDAMKRKNLPAWIREGLEKMEREKQKKKEEEARRKKLEASKKPLWAQEEEEEEAAEDDLENGPASRLKTRRDEESDEELPDVEPPHPKEELSSNAHHVELDRRHRKASPQLILLSPEEKELQFALNVKRLMTEILMSVLQSETADVAQEEIRRARNRMSTRPKKVTTALASIVGLAGYSDSDASDEEDQGCGSRSRKEDNDDSDLEERIRVRRKEFRKWEESAMKNLEDKEREQQRRLNGDDREESASPVNHGGRTSQQAPSPRISNPKLRDERSASRSPEVIRKDSSEKGQDRASTKDFDVKRRSRSRSRTKEHHHKKEKTKRTSSRSSSSESSRSSSKRKRSSKKERRRSREREHTRKRRDSTSRSRSRSRSHDYRRARSGSRSRRQRSRSRDRRRDRSRSYDRRNSRDKSRDRKSTRDRSRDRRGSRDVSRDRRRRRDYSRERKRR